MLMVTISNIHASKNTARSIGATKFIHEDDGVMTRDTFLNDENRVIARYYWNYNRMMLSPSNPVFNNHQSIPVQPL